MSRPAAARAEAGVENEADFEANIESDLPEVSISEEGPVRHLHLGTPWIQGSINLRHPDRLELQYVQRMMGWLLLAPDLDDAVQGHAMQQGLGAGALTRFCMQTLGMCATAIEINPQVLAACRHWFRLPEDGPLLRVVLADAAEEIRREEWLGTVDALQVDLYDHQAAAPVLDSAAFYADCRRLLTADGVMSVNLFGRAASFERSMQCMSEAFGAQALWAFKPTREGNTVVLAQRRPSRPGQAALQARAHEITQRWGLPASGWPKLLKPWRK